MYPARARRWWLILKCERRAVRPGRPSRQDRRLLGIVVHHVGNTGSSEWRKLISESDLFPLFESASSVPRNARENATPRGSPAPSPDDPMHFVWTRVQEQNHCARLAWLGFQHCKRQSHDCLSRVHVKFARSILRRDVYAVAAPLDLTDDGIQPYREVGLSPGASELKRAWYPFGMRNDRYPSISSVA